LCAEAQSGISSVSKFESVQLVCTHPSSDGAVVDANDGSDIVD
jgi:hypothetical protein